MDCTLPGSIALGLALGLTPGPVVAETIRRGTTAGLRPALGVAAGGAAGNAAVALLAALGAAALVAAPGVARPLSVLAAGWVGFLAVDSWRQAGRVAAGGAGEAGTVAGCPGWLVGLMVVVANPVVWTFWLAAMAAAEQGAGAWERVLFAGGFIAGLTASDAALAIAAAREGRRLGPRGQAVALRACALLLLAFAVLIIAGTVEQRNGSLPGCRRWARLPRAARADPGRWPARLSRMGRHERRVVRSDLPVRLPPLRRVPPPLGASLAVLR
ncbi:MAG: LysE family transporter [Armatimonadetes bacterium]|nr:LysE family transporter [Armatimonadota bacterium]